MPRRAISAIFALAVLAPAGERVQAIYREGSELVWVQESSLVMEVEEASVTVNGMELPPEALEEMELDSSSLEQETSMRGRDVVLEAADGRPTRVRRTFEHLREHAVEDGEETDRVGPLEGRTLVLVEEDGEVVAELEDEGEEVDEIHLAGHSLTNLADLLLPEGEVEPGDEWDVESAAALEFLGLESSPVVFEPDEEDEDMFDKVLQEQAEVTSRVQFAEMEEREGLRCAVLDFTIQVEAEVDDPAALGIELEEGMEDPSASFRCELVFAGKLWFALAEGRPVAIEQDLEGSAEFVFEVGMQVEGQELRMKTELAFSIEGEASFACRPPE